MYLVCRRVARPEPAAGDSDGCLGVQGGAHGPPLAVVATRQASASCSEAKTALAKIRLGDVRERPNRRAWRARGPVRGPRVQIPSSPPLSQEALLAKATFIVGASPRSHRRVNRWGTEAAITGSPRKRLGVHAPRGFKSRPHRVRLTRLHFRPETCGSGLTGTPGERVTPRGVQGFKSLRLRHPRHARPCWPMSLFASLRDEDDRFLSCARPLRNGGRHFL